MCKDFGNNVYQCNGNCVAGSIWGSGIYTADSNIWKAAKHMGYIPGVFTKIVAPGLQGYKGTTQNGITTSQYGQYGSSYFLVKGAINVNMNDAQYGVINDKIVALTNESSNVKNTITNTVIVNQNAMKAQIQAIIDKLSVIQNLQQSSTQTLQNNLKQIGSTNSNNTISQIKKLQQKISQLKLNEQRILASIGKVEQGQNNEKRQQKAEGKKMESAEGSDAVLHSLHKQYIEQLRNHQINMNELVGKKQLLCVLCLNNRREILIMPCNHLKYCRKCYKDKIANEQKCGECHADIAGFLQIKL